MYFAIKFYKISFIQFNLMAKIKTRYICTSCDAIYPQWQGKCTSCGEWNTIVRENLDGSKLISGIPSNPTSISLEKIDKNFIDTPRFQLTLNSLNRVLSGGIVNGQQILFAGEPGIGKSTLLTQICLKSKEKILYISGEESIEQITKRALRLGEIKDFANTEFSDNTNLEEIVSHINSKKFNLIIIDSIQTVRSSEASGFPGSMNQIRECATYIIENAKKAGIAIIMIGQITKEGSIAGPKILEHMVDTVLYFEGDQKNDTRILRITKNRFGNTNEIAIYEMQSYGLKEVVDLEWFYSESIQPDEGVSYTVFIDGNTYFIIEIQALCSKSTFAYPKRVSNGYESKRLEMIIAILSKKLGLKLENYDIYINVVGGLKINDTSADLAVASAIMSSYFEKAINEKICLLGEVSLTGEIRSVNKIDQKLNKANEFRFKKIITYKDFKNIKEYKKNFFS
jgi:DNA repair protein RadA/Sms